MKRLVNLLTVLLIVFGLVGCQEKKKTPEGAAKKINEQEPVEEEQ